MKAELWLTRRIVHPDGHQDVLYVPSKSFVQQFAQFMLSCWGATTVANVRDITNTLRTIRAPGTAAENWQTVHALAGVVDRGIRVGTDGTAPAISDYVLLGPIAHGNAAGELEHLLSIEDAVVVAAPSASFKARRTFNNNSGGVITVKEWAIYCRSYYTPASPGTWCLVRDADLVGDAIPDGGAYQVGYTLSVTV